MKIPKIISLALLTGLITTAFLACSDELPATKVPSLVQNSFSTAFPNAEEIEWKKKLDAYQAEFNMASVEYKAQLDSTGQLLAHLREITEDSLPDQIRAAIQRDHPDSKPDDVAKISGTGFECDEIELEVKGKKDFKIYYLPDGTLLTAGNFLLNELHFNRVADPVNKVIKFNGVTDSVIKK